MLFICRVAQRNRSINGKVLSKIEQKPVFQSLKSGSSTDSGNWCVFYFNFNNSERKFCTWLQKRYEIHIYGFKIEMEIRSKQFLRHFWIIDANWIYRLIARRLTNLFKRTNNHYIEVARNQKSSSSTCFFQLHQPLASYSSKWIQQQQSLFMHSRWHPPSLRIESDKQCWVLSIEPMWMNDCSYRVMKPPQTKNFLSSCFCGFIRSVWQEMNIKWFMI